MSLSDRAIAARAQVNWWTLVGSVALRQGLIWGLVTATLIFTLTSLTQISAREAKLTFLHVRASSAIAASQPYTPVKVLDDLGRQQTVTAFQVVTHPAIRATAKDTKARLRLYGILALIGGALTFLLGGYSVIRGVRR